MPFVPDTIPKEHPGFDTVAITMVNDHSFRETDKRNGKVVSTGTFTLASDGKSGTYEFKDVSGASR